MTDTAVDRPTGDQGDPLADFRVNGGIFMDEFHQADRAEIGDNGETVSSLALASAGTHDAGGRELTKGERIQSARNIDQGVRAFAAYLDSRPLIEQVRAGGRPVIHLPPLDGGSDE